MKTIFTRLPRFCCVWLFVVACSSHALAQESGIFDPDTASGSKQFKGDTAFIRQHIRTNIMEIKSAQLAQQRASRPAIKTIAREIETDHRNLLRQLLSIAEEEQLTGVKQADLDQFIDKFGADEVLSPTDSAAAATTGNTATDSLGSGSSGSGNVHGEDTGTLARTRAGKRNANYTETGDAYSYNNQKNLEAMKTGGRQQTKKFEEQWLRMMLRMHDEKLSAYNTAAEQIKGEKLKMLVMQAIPKIRGHRQTLMQMRKGRDNADGLDGTPDGPGQQNRGRNDRQSPDQDQNSQEQ